MSMSSAVKCPPECIKMSSFLWMNLAYGNRCASAYFIEYLIFKYYLFRCVHLQKIENFKNKI
eukprot:GAHX01002354.1.p1 GENE.GAHX01002354.1~~GAHX01002354.1.p1  ORF type:complete len:62 (-),score=2.41 GAHX01002354.1:26-211(-)